jgi:hypothetical protein
LIARILSGGQTGVDRAALDLAVSKGIAYGGWCPRGGWAEDLPRPPGVLAAYPCLTETPSDDPRQRTEWNVRDSGATLVISVSGAESAGTELTRTIASEMERPLLVVPGAPGDGAAIRDFVAGLEDELTLNVAGPRESEAPGAYEAATALLSQVLG